MPQIKFYNSLSGKKEIFKPIKPKQIGLYTCGPTVYDYDHLGHAWNYTTGDFLRRTLEYNNYEVKHVLNITDVGHLVADADTGEDKMEKSAAEKGKTAWEIADFFTEIYLNNRRKLNLEEPTVICRATDHIKEMTALVQTLLDKDYAYRTDDGIYFDTSKFKKYGRLSGNTLDRLKEGARVEKNPAKKNPSDFALWKFSPQEGKRHMEWPAFGKQGFPGWHIECSAMSMKYLGPSFDIHTGGEDNIFPHHESEIAQSEAATGKKFVNYWFHTRFLQVEGKKMSKSLHNFYTIGDLEKKGFGALDLRYLFSTAHYRSKLNFTWQSLETSQEARKKLAGLISEEKDGGKINETYREKFRQAINDDINIPKAMALTWQLVKDKKISAPDKRATILDFDKVLGLNLNKAQKEKKNLIPQEIKTLADAREQARSEKNWQQADKIRKEIEKKGYKIEDSDKGPRISPR